MRRINKLWPLDMLFEQSRRYLPSQQLFHLGSTFDKSHPSHKSPRFFSQEVGFETHAIDNKVFPQYNNKGGCKKKTFFYGQADRKC